MARQAKEEEGRKVVKKHWKMIEKELMLRDGESEKGYGGGWISRRTRRRWWCGMMRERAE